MIERKRFLDHIRRLGYAHKTTQRNTLLFTKSGSTHKLLVPRKGTVDVEYVRSALRQAGCLSEEIESFISNP